MPTVSVCCILLVISVQLDIPVDSAIFLSNAQRRLTLLFRDAFQRQSDIKQGIYTSYRAAGRSVLSKEFNNVCAKVSLTTFNKVINFNKINLNNFPSIPFDRHQMSSFRDCQTKHTW